MVLFVGQTSDVCVCCLKCIDLFQRLLMFLSQRLAHDHDVLGEILIGYVIPLAGDLNVIGPGYLFPNLNQWVSQVEMASV